jgi:hypothetical protein
MRIALCMAFGLAAVVGVVPAAPAQDSQVMDQGKSAGTGAEAKGRQITQRLGRGISLAVPTGRISVDPQTVAGEPIFVRRATVRDGMTIVEVSTAPFIPVVRSSEENAEAARSNVRSDQPASW